MSASGNNQTHAGKLAVPKSHKDTGKPMASAAALACEMPFIQAIKAAMTPAKVAISMAKEGTLPCSCKNKYKNQAAPHTASADKGQRIKFDN